MSIHIIIDGYNLIHQSKTLSRLDQQDIMLGRDALVDMLAAYRKIKPHRITVVFDGHHSPVFSQTQDRRKGIAIRFSRRGESADHVIKQMARKGKKRWLSAQMQTWSIRRRRMARQRSIRHRLKAKSGWPVKSTAWKPRMKSGGAGGRLQKRKAPPAGYPKDSAATG